MIIVLMRELGLQEICEKHLNPLTESLQYEPTLQHDMLNLFHSKQNADFTFSVASTISITISIITPDQFGQIQPHDLKNYLIDVSRKDKR